MAELIANEPDLPCEAGRGGFVPSYNHDRINTHFEVRQQVIADAQRALRLYPEWCDAWGKTQNLNVATQGALECARMLEVLPTSLPADDEEAARLIAAALSGRKP